MQISNDNSNSNNNNKINNKNNKLFIRHNFNDQFLYACRCYLHTLRTSVDTLLTANKDLFSNQARMAYIVYSNETKLFSNN